MIRAIHSPLPPLRFLPLLALLGFSCNTLVRLPDGATSAGGDEQIEPLSTAELLAVTLENVGEVEPGLLYRSDQPSPSLLEHLAERVNLRYIVSLRGRTEDYVEEFAAERGCETIAWRMSAKRPPTPKLVLDLIRLTHRAREEGGSILIHCAAGADRTGMMIALWRMLFQNVEQRKWLLRETACFRHLPPAYPNVHRLIEIARPELFRPFAEDPSLLDDDALVAAVEAQHHASYPLISGENPATIEPGSLRAGAAKVDLLDDWSESAQMATYGPGPSTATRVHDPVHARAVVLDNGRTRVAVVSCDLLITDAKLRAKVLERVNKLAIDVDDVLLAATHTHTSLGAFVDNPAFAWYMLGPYDPKLFDHLAGVITRSIQQAAGSLQDAKLGVTRTRAPGLNRNRRLGSTVDDEVLLLQLRTTDDEPLAAIVNFAGHPILAPDNGEISADYPGIVTAWLDEHHGLGLFLGGALGDLNARRPRGGDDEFATEGLAEETGAGLIEVITKALDEDIEMRRDIELASMTAWLDLPGANISVVPDILFPLDRLLAILVDWKSRYPLQTMRIGDVSLVATASEIGHRLGLEIKARSPAKFPLVVTHANAYAGYAFRRSTHGLRKIDAGSLVSMNGSGHGPEVVEAALRMVESQWPGEEVKPAWDAIGRHEYDPLEIETRRPTALIGDSGPFTFRGVVSGASVDDRRGGHRTTGRVRDVDFRGFFGLSNDLRLDVTSGLRRAEWRSAAGGGSLRDDGAKDLVLGLERPFTLATSGMDGNALRLLPRLQLSAPTGDPNASAPFAFAAGSGVWRPGLGVAAELTWNSNHAVTLESLHITSVDDHRGRRPGDRWEGALRFSERLGALSVHLGTTAAVQFADQRAGGRRPVDVRELSFEVGLRPAISFRVRDRAEIFVEGHVPLARGGSGAGEGNGVMAGLLVEF